jgi:asparagine synthase (glutamine-hydrolysing)
MCGIAGLIVPSLNNASLLEHITHQMLKGIPHRGPDDQGVWVEASHGISFGHTRLSIVDLSAAGHQPMVAQNGQGVLVYNGETYSHSELNALMGEDVHYKSHTDTEVMVESFSRTGLHKSLEHLIGMFAFAYYDKTAKTVTLVRDRFGIKPLYWAKYKGGIAFGSELKTLEQIDDLEKVICPQAVSAMTRFGYVPHPLSIYKNIHKLSPAHALTMDLTTGNFDIKPYWDVNEKALSGQTNLLKSEKEATGMLENLLEDSIKRRLQADVDIGCFLSGGIDSSLVTALASKHYHKKIHTFSLGFEHKDFDESPYAQAVSDHLGTNHHTLMLSEADMLKTVPLMAYTYDEPFADSSQIPTYLVSKLAREHVTVCLGGDGGDELFGGYERYLRGEQIWRGLDNMPLPEALGVIIERVSAKRWDMLSKIIPKKKRPLSLGERAHRLAYLMQSKTPSMFYQKLIEQWVHHENIMNPDIFQGAEEMYPDLPHYAFHDNLRGVIENMQLVDTKTYMSDDILTKVDRASMAHGLEARVPLLDHRLFELAWRMPLSMKIKKNKGKIPLRTILEKHIPKKLFDRPKKGFHAPLSQWLRHELKDWAWDLLNDASIHDYFNKDIILKTFDDHMKGRYHAHYSLWTVIMFQAWRRTRIMD